jgi:murein DD-endopeptidase MepM/ murein hydrolase activator NlpD
VVTVLCNVAGRSYTPTGGTLPCDVDGNPQIGGCGWYVQIRHLGQPTGDVVTRYCHMVRQPAVTVGQTVTVGQPIGLVGSSGNSSGPHLHFEVHSGYPATEANAIEPAGFLRYRGVSI